MQFSFEENSRRLPLSLRQPFEALGSSLRSLEESSEQSSKTEIDNMHREKVLDKLEEGVCVDARGLFTRYCDVTAWQGQPEDEALQIVLGILALARDALTVGRPYRKAVIDRISILRDEFKGLTV